MMQTTVSYLQWSLKIFRVFRNDTYKVWILYRTSLPVLSFESRGHKLLRYRTYSEKFWIICFNIVNKDSNQNGWYHADEMISSVPINQSITQGALMGRKTLRKQTIIQSVSPGSQRILRSLGYLSANTWDWNSMIWIHEHALHFAHDLLIRSD